MFMMDALWLCTTPALLRPVLTCVAAYCLEGDVKYCNVLHGDLQSVAIFCPYFNLITYFTDSQSDTTMIYDDTDTIFAY